MALQCVQCRREAFRDAENRTPPWCPSCGGDLKAPQPAAAPAPVTAEPKPAPAEPVRRQEPALRLDELGAPERVFRGSYLGRLACWLCCLVCFGLVTAIGYGVLHQPDRKPHAGLALMGLFAVGGFGSLYFALTLGEISYLVFPTALVQRRGKHTKILPWEDIREVYQTVHATRKEYQVLSPGTVLEITGDIANYRALGELIDLRVAEHLLPSALASLEAGRTVPFGPLGVNGGGLCFDGLSCAWSQVTLAIGLDPERLTGPKRSDLVYLQVHSAVRTKSYKVDIGDIPNFGLFLALVRLGGPQCLPPGV